VATTKPLSQYDCVALICAGILLLRHRPWDMVLVCYGFPSQVRAVSSSVCLRTGLTRLQLQLSGLQHMCRGMRCNSSGHGSIRSYRLQCGMWQRHCQSGGSLASRARCAYLTDERYSCCSHQPFVANDAG
jgi:hypothetical protein